MQKFLIYKHRVFGKLRIKCEYYTAGLKPPEGALYARIVESDSKENAKFAYDNPAIKAKTYLVK